MSRTGL